MTDRRFIEDSFPVKEVGEISAKEKSIRHGHISTLHIWWARRPLAASRATAYAALVPPPKDIEEWQKQRDFIIELSKWENSNNQLLLNKARRDILQAHSEWLSRELSLHITVADIESGKYPPPRILDPFAGGGSYPLEALRLGCEAYSSDYNPVAVLIEKATLEYPQIFGRSFAGMPEWSKSKRTIYGVKETKGKRSQPILFESNTDESSEQDNPLLEAIDYWGKWVLEEAKKELAVYYPPDPDNSSPVGYIWAHTIPCQNPNCGIEIPLMRQFWLARTSNKKVALYPDINSGKLVFRVVGDGYEAWPSGFDPENGTVARAVATCPLCGNVIDADSTRRLFQEGKASQRMLVVILGTHHGGGKSYRIATKTDNQLYQLVETILQKKKERLSMDWGMDPVPDELLPKERAQGFSGFRIILYGMKRWGDLFNSRQQLALITFIEKVRLVHERLENEKVDDEFVQAIMTYLAIGVDRLATFCSTLSWWQPTGEFAVNLFGRQALPMVWDFIEISPLSGASGDWVSALGWMRRTIEHFTTCGKKPAVIHQDSAIHITFPDNYFDAVFTDPPYYDNVAYSDLADFFYVWLKRSVGNVFPDLFSTPLTPKSSEIIQDPARNKDKSFFETHLSKAFREIYRVLRPNGVAVIVYAHKSTEGWETLINSLLDSKLIVTGAWPLHTERSTRFIAAQSAALASSIYIVARKTPRQPTGFYNDVRIELQRYMDTKLQRLWEEGIGGADFFIAAIGSAIEIFGKYEQVIDYEGKIIKADRLLKEVRNIATDYAVRQILHNGFAMEISPIIRLYVLWRWNYGDVLVPFDEGRKLAQSCGVDLTQEWGKSGFVKKEKEFIRLLGPQQRKLEDLEEPRNMIDVLHKALLLWEKGKRGEMLIALADRDYGRSEAFYRVAQAISETLPLESKEKKLLDGFLAGRERMQEEVGNAARQEKLFD